jgi:hydroxymethylbilane synthase
MRIGSRGSALALTQSRYVLSLLPGGADHHSIEVIETQGDRNADLSFRRMTGKGVFTKEIEVAMLERRIDLAVHSLKDLPTEETPGLRIAALLAREDPRDALVSRHRAPLDKLPAGAIVGTSSLRRRSQLLARRPDLRVVELRGNVPTRLERVREGRCDAVIVAAAGLKRLGLFDQVTEVIDESVMLPAPGQGVLALQIRADDDASAKAVAALHDPAAAAESGAERSLLTGLGGGCLVPIGARGRVSGSAEGGGNGGNRGGTIELTAYVGHPDGRPSLRLSLDGSAEAAVEIGRRLAESLLEAGAREILAEVRSDEVFP